MHLLRTPSIPLIHSTKLQLLFNCLVKDHNADAFRGHQFEANAEQRSPLARLLFNCLDGLNKWDARYFITVSQVGYLEPSWIAFFPLYPILIGFLSGSLDPVLHLDYPTINCLAAHLINLACFTGSCIALYKLTICLFGDKLFAINTVKWFAYNPASIFFSATYTESLYSALVFTAIWLLFERYPKIRADQNFYLLLHNRRDSRHSKPPIGRGSSRFQMEPEDENSDRYVKLFSHKLDSELVRKFLNEKCKFLIAILCLILASFTRSNGVVNVGFFWYLFLLDNLKPICCRNWGKLFNLNSLLKFTVLLLSTCLVISPFFVVQYVHQRSFCEDQTTANLPEAGLTKHFSDPASLTKRFDDPELKGQICDITFYRLYSFVQERFWGVGLFKYYQLRKLPNFLLASPMLILVSFIFKYYLECSKSSSNLIKKGLGGQFWNKTALLLPFILHLLFLTLFSVLFINIEVTTRLVCSSSPLVFWSVCKFPRKWQYVCRIYFGAYFLAGAFAFSNFLPWT